MTRAKLVQHAVNLLLIFTILLFFTQAGDGQGWKECRGSGRTVASCLGLVDLWQTIKLALR